MDGTENKTPNQNVRPKFFDDLPEHARNLLTGPWEVSAGFNGPKQVQRTMIKVEDYLDGNTPEGSDKKALKAEAGRILSHIRQSFDDEDFLKDVPQRNYWKSEADRLWDEEGGKEAYDLWRGQLSQSADAPASGETETSEADKILNNLAEIATNLPKIFELARDRLENAIDYLRTNFPTSPRRGGLELNQKILAKFDLEKETQQLLESIAPARESLKAVSGNQYTRVDENRKILSEVRKNYGRIIRVTLINVLNGVQSSSKVAENTQVKTVIDSLYDDIEGILGSVGGVQKIEAEAGMTVDFETMMPAERAVRTDDPRFQGKGIIAQVYENGFMFEGNLQLFDGQAGDVITEAKVAVYR